MKRIINYCKQINTTKTVILSLMVILPLVGSQLKSVYLWGEKVYNLHDYMASMTTKKEFHSQSFEVLLFIEEALRDDISALEWTINDTIKNVEMTDMEKHKEINNLRRSLKQKVIAQNGIQKRLKTLNPNWKTLEEIEDAKR